ncbi:MAG: helix-turn-helix transcriptional regulator [Deltaproteobacteria bacterium]|nr:helix-turn-helix transcriptional regulator [Deltaproteobacteria bacterium]
MTIYISTEKGNIKVIPTFHISRLVKKKIEESLRMAVEDVKPIEPLLEKIKREDPLIGSPRSALMAYITGQSLTQKRLAQKTGISQADISKMIHGKRPIGPAVAKKLGKALGVSYHKFL